MPEFRTYTSSSDDERAAVLTAAIRGVTAYDEQRQDVRRFNLDRIAAVGPGLSSITVTLD